MIFIESYILNPLDVRGGENILEPITTFGGYKSNITINSDGSGRMVYNNSDYTISLSNDLIVGNTSYFTLSNVGNNDSVKLYEDSTLISTTTGNSVAYTPSVAGEHEIYFKINNVSTGTITVTAYTLTSTTISGITPVNNIVYFHATEALQVTIKPNISEDVELNNIPCVITYGSRTMNVAVSNLGTTVSIQHLLTSSASTNTLSINCAGDTTTYTVQEYFSVFATGMMSEQYLTNITPSGNLRSIIQRGVWGIINPTSGTQYVKVDDAGISEDILTYLKLEIDGNSPVGSIYICDESKTTLQTISISSSDKMLHLRLSSTSQGYLLEVAQSGGATTQYHSIEGREYYIGVPGSDKILIIKSLLYGVK